MLSYPRCDTGNLKEGGSLSMHLTRFCMGPSLLFHAQSGTLAKKCSDELMLSGSCPLIHQQQIRNFFSLTVYWHYLFHLLRGHSTQPQTRHHVHANLCKKCPKVFLEYLHCLLATKYKTYFCRIPGNQRCNNSNNIINYFWSALYSSSMIKVMSITCIGFIQ